MIDPTAKLICIPSCQTPAVSSMKHQATCGHEVWVAVSSVPVVENGNEIICVTCAHDLAELIRKAEAGEVQSVPGALTEIEAQFGVRFRSDLEEDLIRRGVQTDG